MPKGKIVSVHMPLIIMAQSYGAGTLQTEGTRIKVALRKEYENMTNEQLVKAIENSYGAPVDVIIEERLQGYLEAVVTWKEKTD